jgi:VIT1/CCC1 family predicted Fe2+/Mn2+ transporter
MPTRDLDNARHAYENADAEASRLAHRAKGGVAPEEHGQGQYVKSFIYGGLDGTITTFAVVAGVAGAHLSAGVVLILGFANLFADGISMAMGDYLSSKAEREYNEKERHREAWEVEHYPEGEKQEMVEIYMEKGVPETDAHTIVDILSQHKDAWVEVMMREELGIVEDASSPLKNALVTFGSFVCFGFVPLVTYLFIEFAPSFVPNAFAITCGLTALTLFILGALKVKITNRTWYAAGTEMLLVGGIAAAVAYVVGILLAGMA